MAQLAKTKSGRHFFVFGAKGAVRVVRDELGPEGGLVTIECDGYRYTAVAALDRENLPGVQVPVVRLPFSRLRLSSRE